MARFDAAEVVHRTLAGRALRVAVSTRITMPLGDDRKAGAGLNFILARIVAGLWQGRDQFAVPDAEMVRAYGSTLAEPLLQELGEGWSAARPTEASATIFTRIISARAALIQLGF